MPTATQIKHPIPLANVESLADFDYKRVIFADDSKLVLAVYGQPDSVVQDVCRQFCRPSYGYGVGYPRKDDESAIEEVLCGLKHQSSVDESCEYLSQLLDTPATVERIKAICPAWYPLWCEQYIRQEVIEAARCLEVEDVWEGIRRGYRAAQVEITLKPIHKSLIDKVNDDYPELFSEPDDAE